MSILDRLFGTKKAAPTAPSTERPHSTKAADANAALYEVTSHQRCCVCKIKMPTEERPHPTRGASSRLYIPPPDWVKVTEPSHVAYLRRFGQSLWACPACASAVGDYIRAETQKFEDQKRRRYEELAPQRLKHDQDLEKSMSSLKLRHGWICADCHCFYGGDMRAVNCPLCGSHEWKKIHW
jgi:rubrerythrin